MLFPQLVPNVGVVITVKAESCPDDWTEITCSCWAFYPLFCFPGLGLYRHLDRKIWPPLSCSNANALTELDFLCNVMRPAAAMSLANMGNQ